MAFAIIESPSTITPAFNPVAYVINSPNVGQPNHRFVAVIKDDAGTTLQELEFVSPPSLTNAYIDISRVVSNYLTFDIDFTMVAIQRMMSSIKEIEVEFGERYGTTETLNIVTSTIYVTNMGLDTYDWLNYATTDYISTFINKDTTNITEESESWLYFYQEAANSVDGVRITSSDGTTDKVSVINNPFKSMADWEDGFCFIPSGSNINDIDASEFSSGAGNVGNVMRGDTVTLKFELLDGGAVVLDTHTYTIIQSCFKPQLPNIANYELYYMNSVGGFDTLVLNRAFHKTKDLQREGAARIVGGMTSETTYGYNTFDAGRVDRVIGFMEKWKLNTTWISETESTNYFQLVGSPVVFLNDEGTFKRVNISLNNYKEKTERTDRLFNFEIEVMESQKQERQWVN